MRRRTGTASPRRRRRPSRWSQRLAAAVRKVMADPADGAALRGGRAASGDPAARRLPCLPAAGFRNLGTRRAGRQHPDGQRLSKARLAVDIGGTFTDLVLELPDRTLSTKVLTTPEAPERGRAGGHARHPGRGRLPAWRGRPGGPRHHAGDQCADRAQGRAHRAAHHRGLPRFRSRSPGSTASSSTTSTWSGPSRWCRATCASACPSGSPPTARCCCRSTRRRCAASAARAAAREDRGGRRLLPAQLHQRGA